MIKVLVVCFLLTCVDCESHFKRLWNEVVYKLDFKDAGIGPFENAEYEFGPESKSKRLDIFKKNAETLMGVAPFKTYETELNFFALLDQTEWARYLSAPNLDEVILLKELLVFYAKLPSNLASIDLGDFSEVVVNTRHSGAYPSWGIMTAVMHLEYLYKSLLDIPKSDVTIFSSQYFLNCVKGEDLYYRPYFPHEVWKTLQEHTFIGLENTSEMEWSGVKQECKDTPPNALEEGMNVTAYHMVSTEKVKMEESLKRAPLTVCLHVEVDHIGFFFYQSGLFTDLVTANVFVSCTHFVLFVSYEDDHYLVQNSWGTDWGMKGKMAVNRNSIIKFPIDQFILFYPVLKYKEVEPTSRFEFVEIWDKKDARHYDDYYIEHGIEEGNIFEIRSNSTVDVKLRYLETAFNVFTQTDCHYYNIVVNFKEKLVHQFAHLPQSALGIYDKLTEEMGSPDASPDRTVLRIRVEEHFFAAFLNDQPLKVFPHLQGYMELNIIEATSDGEVEIVQLEERMVPVLSPNSGELCRNSELGADCEMWRQSGYCQDTSQYQEFMAESCAISCGSC